MSLTSPLGLMRHVRKPDLRMEMVPWLNGLLLGLLVYMLGSSYIWAPGLVVANSALATEPAKLSLPATPIVAGDPHFAGQPDAILVITKPQFALNPTTKQLDIVRPPQYILNNGARILEDLPLALERLRKSLPVSQPVLLIKGDNEVPYGTILKVCVLAQEAGFSSELWAFMPTGVATATPPARSAASPTPDKAP